MRKPKYTIKELREKHKIQLKNVSKKNPVYKSSMKKRQEKEINNLKLRISNYKGYTKLIEKRDNRLSKLYSSTKEKVKGKSKKQISNIWSKYNISKLNIVQGYREKSLKYSSTGLAFYSSEKGVFSKAQTYSISPDFDPDKKIENFINKHISNENIRYFLIILKGRNSITGEISYVSDSFSRDSITENFVSINSIYSDLLSSLSYRGTKSSENFELMKIYIKTIYSLSDASIEKTTTKQKERL